MTSGRLVVCASHSPGKERDVEKAFGPMFRSALATAADTVSSFNPDIVIVFGGDHRRAFTTVVPTKAAIPPANWQCPRRWHVRCASTCSVQPLT
jgi:hypothetical protein